MNEEVIDMEATGTENSGNREARGKVHTFLAEVLGVAIGYVLARAVGL